MKSLLISSFRTSLIAAALTLTPLSPALHSQDVGMFAKVNVPFAFETASGHRFNAGVYTLRVENSHTLLIKGATDAGLTMTTVVDNAQPALSGKAIFHRYGNRYFLSEISVSGESRRLEFHPAKAERQSQIAAGKPTPDKVEVAVLNSSR